MDSHEYEYFYFLSINKTPNKMNSLNVRELMSEKCALFAFNERYWCANNIEHVGSHARAAASADASRAARRARAAVSLV